MKTIIATIAVVSLLVVGTMAFAHGTGGWKGHMGPGYGKGGGPGARADQEFLDKTVDLRKAFHDKKFEYREAARNPETTVETLTKIEKDIFDIQTKIREIAPRSAAYSWNGPCWER